MLQIKEVLKDAIENKASDIHLKVGTKPKYRIAGDIQESNFDVISANDFESILDTLDLTSYQMDKLIKNRQIDIGYGLEGIGRFRVNVFYQRGSYAAVFRFLPYNIPTLEELGLPDVVREIALKPRGLVLITGVTGSGKSTTLASMIELINEQKAKNIITIEDPIEYIFNDKKSIVIQRQVGFDCIDFAWGLRGALREDPDVIMVGEMRDSETIKIALEAAETGHLVLSTLHTLNATETVNRIVSTFDYKDQKQIRSQLSNVIEAVISQRLIKSTSKERSRVVATEILLGTDFVRQAILDPQKSSDLSKALILGTNGMRTFDFSLMELYNKGLISIESALEFANNPNDLSLKFKGIY
ncbi:MAG: type IV pilus twitching motility protein PilT [Desulfurella sp.]|uniref:type IV pilus twitching motility protein PilT n=1 Tax=Desulfurella TaxID=33001 RepID=UPI002357B38A|nr:PilT/PilU family type 4a pilus ATPase [Desulfurella multipotens]